MHPHPYHKIQPFRWQMVAWMQVVAVLALLAGAVSPQWHGVLFHGDDIAEAHSADNPDHSQDREHSSEGDCLLCLSAQGGGVFEAKGALEWNAPAARLLTLCWHVTPEVIQGATLHGVVSIRGPPVVEKG